MRTYTVTTKSSDEIAAGFAAVFKDIKPAERKQTVTLADSLAPYRKDILKQRRRGLSWKQIAAGMADPRIGAQVSAKSLREVFAERKVAPAAANSASQAPSKPAPRFLVVDPLTGQRVNPQA